MNELDMQQEQVQDESSAWVNGRLLRQPLDVDGVVLMNETDEDGKILRRHAPAHHYRFVVLVAGKCADDFYAEPGSNLQSDVNPLFTFVGDRVSEKTLRESGFEKAKAVTYNTISREINIVR